MKDSVTRKTMIKVIAVCLMILMLLSFASCGNINDKANDKDLMVSATNESTSIETEALTEAETNSYEMFSEQDLKNINAIYANRNLWEMFQSEETLQYSRTEYVEAEIIHLYYSGMGEICFFVDGIINENQAFKCFYLFEDGVLSETSYFDPKTSIDVVEDCYASSTYDIYDSEEEKLTAIKDLYKEYLEERQLIYADVEEIEDTIRLSGNKRKLYNRILKTESEWCYLEREKSRVRFLKIWAFEDGSCEMCCFYSPLRITEETESYSGYYSAFKIDDDIIKLSDEEEERLKYDLKYDERCFWSNVWTFEKKEITLKEYINSLELH